MPILFPVEAIPASRGQRGEINGTRQHLPKREASRLAFFNLDHHDLAMDQRRSLPATGEAVARLHSLEVERHRRLGPAVRLTADYARGAASPRVAPLDPAGVRQTRDLGPRALPAPV